MDLRSLILVALLIGTAAMTPTAIAQTVYNSIPSPLPAAWTHMVPMVPWGGTLGQPTCFRERIRPTRSAPASSVLARAGNKRMSPGA